jgi:hypothetical protein
MQTLPHTACLVSCVSQKRERACEAQDFYISEWFRKARHFAETSGCPWYILSAEHGLVRPEQLVAPYEKHLTRWPSMLGGRGRHALLNSSP